MANEHTPFTAASSSDAMSDASSVSASTPHQFAATAATADPSSRLDEQAHKSAPFSTEMGHDGDRSGAAYAGADDSADAFASSVNSTMDDLAGSAGAQADRLREGLDEAGDRVEDSAARLSQIGGEWADSLRDTVREHPLAALGAALALGMLVAKLAR